MQRPLKWERCATTAIVVPADSCCFVKVSWQAALLEYIEMRACGPELDVVGHHAKLSDNAVTYEAAQLTDVDVVADVDVALGKELHSEEENINFSMTGWKR